MRIHFVKRLLLVLFLSFACAGTAYAQFTDSSSGLLQMPTAEMQQSGTFMITNNYLNSNSLPSSGWGYDTFAYGFSITFWDRLEVGYVCTIFDGKRKPNPSERDLIMFNQDRHFLGRFQVLKEGEFGVKWLPSIVLGISDPTTGSSENGYIDANVEGSGNGYFNRMYAAATKRFHTTWGEVGVHLAYQYNKRTDYALNGPCAGVNWKPSFLCDKWLLDSVNLIAEYDSRTVNLGFVASVWDNRFEAMFELQGCKWINFGLRYKVRLK